MEQIGALVGHEFAGRRSRATRLHSPVGTQSVTCALEADAS